jgi:hypothetical protein
MARAAGATNPLPLVNWPLTPAAVAPAGAGFTLTVHGTGFVSGSVVRWNGIARPTTFVSSSKLSAVIPATDISHATTSAITVFTPTEWSKVFSKHDGMDGLVELVRTLRVGCDRVAIFRFVKAV